MSLRDQTTRLRQSIDPVLTKHHHAVGVSFFLGGFIFDSFMLERIDAPKQIGQQVVYLSLAGFLIALKFLEEQGAVRADPNSRFTNLLLRYGEGITHFLLGTLLNCYMMLFFKSSSFSSSAFFVLALMGLILINEFKPFKGSRFPLQVALFGLCWTSFCTALVPVALGTIGLLPFLVSIVVASAILILPYRLIQKKLQHPRGLRKKLVTPILGIQGLFTLLYITGALPPIPLALEEIGVYHQIEKIPHGTPTHPEGGYRLSYSRSKWRFWEHGAQTFYARPGDTISTFVRVFSPARFKGELKVRWSLDDPRRGWVDQDSIPLPISGGREEGYRGFTTKSHYQPGDWRVQVLTADGREVGRISITIVADASTDPREMTVIEK